MRIKAAVIVAHRLSNVSVDSVFEEKDILDWVRRNYEPEEVFTDADLTKWAEYNDFIKEQE